MPFSISKEHASKRALAQRLAAMGMRAVTIADITGLRRSKARECITFVQQQQPKSGQRPTERRWFLATPDRCRHGAFLLMSYFFYRRRFLNVKDSHVLAFTLAYELYRRMMGEGVEICIERFNLLVNGFNYCWKEIPDGAESEGHIKVMLCDVCNRPHLTDAHRMSYTCRECEKKSRRQSTTKE